MEFHHLQNQEIVGNGSMGPETNEDPSPFACKKVVAETCQATTSTAIVPFVEADINIEGEEFYKVPKDQYLNSFPPGYKFVPSDFELIYHYLCKKASRKQLPPNKIQEVELYKYSPDHLAERYEPLGENEWYFFTPRDRKYRKGKRPNRSAGDGYWKATGAEKPIYSEHPPQMIGSKRSLVYFRGEPRKGSKTDWIMHEYEVASAPKRKTSGDDMRLDDCVLCKIRRRPSESSKTQPKEIHNTSEEKEVQEQQPPNTPTPANHHRPGNQQALNNNPALSPNELAQPNFGHDHQENGDIFYQLNGCASHYSNNQYFGDVLINSGCQVDNCLLPPTPDATGFFLHLNSIATESGLIFDYDHPFSLEMFGDDLTPPVQSSQLPAPSGDQYPDASN